jgi:hypothetical protein
MEGNRIPRRVFYMNLETTTSKNWWKDEGREYGRIVGRELWQEKAYDTKEWKKILKTARNRRVLHLPME